MDRFGFIHVRLAAPKQKKTRVRKPPKKKHGDKNLSFASCSQEIQKGLRKPRAPEWQKSKQFNAGVLLSDEELQKLLGACVQVNPTQWKATDGNAHKRRDGRTSLLTSRVASSAAGIARTRMASVQTRRLESLTRTTSFSQGAGVIRYRYGPQIIPMLTFRAIRTTK